MVTESKVVRRLVVSSIAWLDFFWCNIEKIRLSLLPKVDRNNRVDKQIDDCERPRKSEAHVAAVIGEQHRDGKNASKRNACSMPSEARPQQEKANKNGDRCQDRYTERGKIMLEKVESSVEVGRNQRGNCKRFERIAPWLVTLIAHESNETKISHRANYKWRS